MLAHIRTTLSKIEKAILAHPTWFEFSKKRNDGRLNSIEDEDVVANYLHGHPDLAGLLVKKSDDNREFGDFGIAGAVAVPCNIKVISDSTTSGSNSCGPTKLIGYTFQRPCRDHNAIARIMNDLESKGYDTFEPSLYGLVLISKETKKCWIGTMDELPADCISTNPSNPLQITFPSSRVSRTSKEYIALLISKLDEYYEKKGKPWEIRLAARKVAAVATK